MNLNTLENEARKLVTLLEHREPGLLTWRWLLATRIRAIRDLTDSQESLTGPFTSQEG